MRKVSRSSMNHWNEKCLSFAFVCRSLPVCCLSTHFYFKVWSTQMFDWGHFILTSVVKLGGSSQIIGLMLSLKMSKPQMTAVKSTLERPNRLALIESLFVCKDGGACLTCRSRQNVHCSLIMNLNSPMCPDFMNRKVEDFGQMIITTLRYQFRNLCKIITTWLILAFNWRSFFRFSAHNQDSQIKFNHFSITL